MDRAEFEYFWQENDAVMRHLANAAALFASDLRFEFGDM